jgi:hypothetical protein
MEDEIDLAASAQPAAKNVPLLQVRRPEQAPVGDGPDAGGARLYFAATGDDEAESRGVALEATHGERAQYLGERAGEPR